jgi:Peptidase C65 Otubain
MKGATIGSCLLCVPDCTVVHVRHLRLFLRLFVRTNCGLTVVLFNITYVCEEDEAYYIKTHVSVKEVEPMGRESDHIHISIMCKLCGVPVRIVYLDRSVGTSQDATNDLSVNHHDFPEDSSPKVFLL